MSISTPRRRCAASAATRGSGAHRRRKSVEGRGRRQPADGAAGHPVRRRAGVLPRLRAVRPAARARRSAGHAGALHLSVQAHQQARRAVLSADGGGGRDHRGDDGAARLHAAAPAAAGAALRLGARQGRCASAPLKLGRLALAGLRRHRAVVRVHRARPALRHHAALVRGDLGARRRALRGAHARSLPRAARISERGARHDQYARHRRDRRRRRRRLLHCNRAGDPSLAVALDARGRLSGDGAARHAGAGRRAGACCGFSCSSSRSRR